MIETVLGFLVQQRRQHQPIIMKKIIKKDTIIIVTRLEDQASYVLIFETPRKRI